MKRCCRCKVEQPLDQFCKDKQTNDGLARRCRKCRNELSVARYAKNPEPAKAQARQWREKNPDYLTEYMRGWRERNPEWRRNWNRANPDKARAWFLANPDRAREKVMRRRALKRAATVGPVDLNALWIANEGKCQLCGEPIDRTFKAPHPMSASVDHIVPLSRGGRHEQSNLQWTHLVENIQKGAKTPVPLGG